MSKANDIEDSTGGPVAGDWPASVRWAIRQYEPALHRLQEKIADTNIDADNALSVADDPIVMVLLEEVAYWGVLVLVAKELAGPR